MWLIKSSIGHKVIMALSGIALVLFLTFHAAMNVVALFSANVYNQICSFLGANWYAVAATTVLAVLVLIHFCLASHLEIWNLQARGPQRYDQRVRVGDVEWSSQHMFSLGTIIILGLVLHLFNFWSKMMYAELSHTADAELSTNGIYHIVNTFHGIGEHFLMGYVYTILYLIWLCALWFHLNHGIWSSMQSLGLNNKVWFPRLRMISRVWASFIIVLFSIVALAFCLGYTPKDADKFLPEIIDKEMSQSKLYEFEVVDNKGNVQSLSQYKGKVLLIVNTATACGFTPQYEDLDSLYHTFASHGFEILDFPCNQFGGQAPGTDDEIQEFCTLRYNTEFPRFRKVEVNGENEIPLYTWLKEQKGFAGFDPAHPLTKILHGMFSKADSNYAEKPDIKWNFTKFIIDADGNVVERFEPTATKAVLAPAIEKVLNLKQLSMANEKPCANCKLRANYDKNPKSLLGRIWRWHINFCPGFNGYYKSLPAEEQQKLSEKYNFKK